MGGGRGSVRGTSAGAVSGPATPGAWAGGLGRVLLDALPAMTVIVDDQGVIAAANEAWRRFGRENGAGPAVAEGVGLDYFAICRDGAMAGCPRSPRAPAGIARVLPREMTNLTPDHPRHRFGDPPWFLLAAPPPQWGGAGIARSAITP